MSHDNDHFRIAAFTISSDIAYIAVCSRHKSAKERGYGHVYLDEMGG